METNVEVLYRIGEVITLLKKIKKGKANCFEHVKGRTEILTSAFEGSVEGVNKMGIRRLKLMDTIKLGDYKTTKRKSWDRRNWRYLPLGRTPNDDESL